MKQEKKELLKQRRKTKVEGWKNTVAAEEWGYAEGSSWVSKLRSGG